MLETPSMRRTSATSSVTSLTLDSDNPPNQTSQNSAAAAYWRENIRILLSLLAIWFAVSFGCGILFVEQLDQIAFFGFPLGFWFAQQGSVYTFLVLIFTYIGLMNRLDKKYNVQEEDV